MFYDSVELKLLKRVAEAATFSAWEAAAVNLDTYRQHLRADRSRGDFGPYNTGNELIVPRVAEPVVSSPTSGAQGLGGLSSVEVSGVRARIDVLRNLSDQITDLLGQHRIDDLKLQRPDNNTSALSAVENALFHLALDCHRGSRGIYSPELLSNMVIVPRIVDDYIASICALLRQLPPLCRAAVGSGVGDTSASNELDFVFAAPSLSASRASAHGGFAGSLRDAALPGPSLSGAVALSTGIPPLVPVCAEPSFTRIRHGPQFQCVRSVTSIGTTIGRTALVLRGGGALAAYHIGVVRCLLECGLLPRIVMASGTAAMIGALVACLPDRALRRALGSDGMTPDLSLGPFHALRNDATAAMLRRAQRLWSEGVLFDVSRLDELCTANIGDLTFAEAYQLTGVAFCVEVNEVAASYGRCNSSNSPRRGVSSSSAVPCTNSVMTATTPLLCSVVTTPNILVRSAVVASCAFRGAYSASSLLAKLEDGTLAPTVPPCLFTQCTTLSSPFATATAAERSAYSLRRLSELFNVSSVVISSPSLFPRSHPATKPSVSAAVPHAFISVVGFAWQLLVQFLSTVISCWLFVAAEVLTLCVALGLPLSSPSGALSHCISKRIDPLMDPAATVSQTVFINPVRRLEPWMLGLGSPTTTVLRLAADAGASAVWPHVARLQRLMAVETTTQEVLGELVSLGRPIPTESPLFEDDDEDATSLPASSRHSQGGPASYPPSFISSEDMMQE